MQSLDSIETYVYGTSKDLVSEKELIKVACVVDIKLFLYGLTLL